MVAPYLVEQLSAGMHPFRVGHQEMQQAELGRAEVHRIAVGGEAVGGRVEAQAADLDGVLGGLRGAAAQHGLDAGHQLAGREGLGDVVVGAGLEAGHLVLLLAAGGEHDERDAAGALLAAQALGELDARHAGQHPVEQDQVGQGVADDALARLGVTGTQHVVTGPRQVGGDEFLDGGLVFDEEDRGGHQQLQGITRRAQCIAAN